MPTIENILRGFALVGAMALLPWAGAWAQASDVDCRGCVNTRDIARGAVSAGKLKKSSVKTGKIKRGAVTRSKIADGAVTAAKLASNALAQGRLLVEDCGSISQPGSYLLVNDLPGPLGLLANGGCLEITADDVTLDLGGFSILGNMTGTGSGILMDGRINVEIRNGTVSGFGGDGISEVSALGQNLRLFDLRVTDNEGDGIFAAGGAGHRVVNCLVRKNGGGGIILPQANVSIVRDNIAVGNAGGNGIRINDGGVVTGNTASTNGGNGIRGGSGNTVSGNTTRGNTLSGIDLNATNFIAGNAASANGAAGILASDGSTVSENTASFNTTAGISVLNGCTVRGNTAFKNGSNGIRIQENSLVIDNTAFNNDLSGSGFPNIECVNLNCTLASNHP